MKTMKALKAHRYNGRMYAVGDTFQVRRADIRLQEALGRGVLTQPEAEQTRVSAELGSYSTRVMTAEPYNFDREYIKGMARRSGLSEEVAEAVAPIMLSEKPAKRKYVRKAKVEE